MWVNKIKGVLLPYCELSGDDISDGDGIIHPSPGDGYHLEQLVNTQLNIELFLTPWSKLMKNNFIILFLGINTYLNLIKT